MYKTLQDGWALLGLLGVLAYACQEEEAAVLSRDPSVNLRFIHQTSIVALERMQADVEAELTEAQQEAARARDSVELYTMRVEEVQARMQDGETGLEELLAALVETRNTFAEEENMSVLRVSDLQMQQRGLATQISNTREGLFWLQRFDAGSGTQQFADSATLFRVPLDLVAQSTTWDMQTPEGAFRLSVSYRLEEFVDEKQQVSLRSHIEAIGMHTFDSVRTRCRNEACIGHETILLLYL